MFALDPTWSSILFVAVFVALTWWVHSKDGSPRLLGIMGLVFAFVTSLFWFTWLPFWTVILVVLVTAILFVIGMFRPENEDDIWHWLALLIGIFGKAFVALVPWVFDLLNGDVVFPKWLMALLVIIALAGVIFGLWPNTREWISRPFSWLARHLRKEKSAPPSTN